MKILEERIIRRLRIEYDNSSKLSRDIALDLLDTRYGEGNYRITRSGPHPFKAGVGIGLMIVEVDA